MKVVITKDRALNAYWKARRNLWRARRGFWTWFFSDRFMAEWRDAWCWLRHGCDYHQWEGKNS